MARNNTRIYYTKETLKYLALAGGIALAMTSPYFLPQVAKICLKAYLRHKKFSKNSFACTFNRLKRQGLINVEKRNHQIYISLTKEGKKRAGKYQIDELSIGRPKEWDGKWRIVIFDIGADSKIKREALRGKLKELGFYQLQKSVWVHLFDCVQEIKLLKEFFGLSNDELRIFLAEDVGGGEDMIRRKFQI